MQVERVHFPNNNESDQAPVGTSRNVRNHLVIHKASINGHPFVPFIPGEFRIVDVHGEGAKKLEERLAA